MKNVTGSNCKNEGEEVKQLWPTDMFQELYNTVSWTEYNCKGVAKS
jgi:hypothetical protein